MILDPAILVECDYCAATVECSMTSLAGPDCWRADGVEDEIRAAGWISRDGGETTFCGQTCAEQYDYNQACLAQEHRDSGR